MNANTILEKGRSGEKLFDEEIHALMLHAIFLLKSIDKETQKSISKANDLLALQFKKAA